MRLLISAGEASGDMYGAQLIAAVRRRAESIEVFGVGGDRMREAGCDTVVNAHDIAVVGLAEVVSHLPGIYRKFRGLLRSIDSRRPDVAVLIDFPDFNLRLAKQLHRRGIPVIYYISPQLWAWRQGRVRQIKRYVSKMLVIFPFEEQWYRERGVQAEFVGHPLAALPAPPISREDFARQYGLDPAKQWIALLPGSRRKEVAMNLPAILKAAKLLGGDSEWILPRATTLDVGWLRSQLGATFANLTIVDDARPALKHARAAIVASGTATVEAALLGTPFVMVYRVSPLSWTFGRGLVKVPHFAMPNLIAGERIVPELVQNDFTAENVAARLREIIVDGPPRRQMLAALGEAARRLRTGPAGATLPPAEIVAEAVLAAGAARAKGGSV
jgi:lipid-A-disaccharide synthase